VSWATALGLKAALALANSTGAETESCLPSWLRSAKTSAASCAPVTSGPTTAAWAASAASRSAWAALAAAAVGRNGVTTRTVSPASSPADGRPARSPVYSTSTRRSPKTLPSSSSRPVRALAASALSAARVPADPGGSASRSVLAESPRPRSHADTASRVWVASAPRSAATTLRQCLRRLAYCADR
jgi:hypothetical protein